MHNPNGNLTHAVLTHRAVTTPDAVAFTHVVRGDVTYGELHERVNRLAHALLDNGVQRGARVACLTHGQQETIEVYLAIAQIGAVIVTVNTLWDDETLATLLERARCTVFVYDTASQEQARRATSRLATVSTKFVLGGQAHDAIDLDAAADSASGQPAPVGASWDDPVLLSFTSGTTGLPKAVIHTHASALENTRIWTDVERGEHPVLFAGPLVVGIVFISTVTPSFWGGVRLILQEDAGMDDFVAAVERYRVTHFSTVVSYFTGAVRNAPVTADLSSLRAVLLGGEPVTRSILETVYDRLPSLSVYSFYGQSEAPYSFITKKSLSQASADLSLSIQTGYSAKVVDGKGRRIVGEVGEILLSGPHVFSGYDGQPDKTAEALRDGWYGGGDLGIMGQNGRVTVYGRREDSIIRDGDFVLLAEVEEAALKLEGIAEAGAAAIGDEEENRKLLLAVVPAAGSQATPQDVLERLQRSAPENRFPDAVVITDNLPYATNMAGRGKLLRREIAARWSDALSAV